MVIDKALETLTSESCRTAVRKSRCRWKPFNFTQMASFTLGTKKLSQFAGVLYFSRISFRLVIPKSEVNLSLTILAIFSEMGDPYESEGRSDSSIDSRNWSLSSSMGVLKSFPPKMLSASSSLLRKGICVCVSSETDVWASSEAGVIASSEAGVIASSEAEVRASSEAGVT
jgi:hypothetical protein